MNLLNPHDLGTRIQLDRFSTFYYEVDRQKGPCAVQHFRELVGTIRNNIGMEINGDLKSAEWPIRLMW